MINQKAFLETDKERAEKMKDFFQQNNINYTSKTIHDYIHFDINNLTDSQIKMIKKYYNKLEPGVIEKRHRKWDDKFHTIGQELKGNFTGENIEEDVEYVRN